MILNYAMHPGVFKIQSLHCSTWQLVMTNLLYFGLIPVRAILNVQMLLDYSYQVSKVGWFAVAYHLQLTNKTIFYVDYFT